MTTDYIFLAQNGFELLTFLCLILILVGARITFLKMSYNLSKANKRTFALGAILLGWLILVSILSFSGILSDFSGFPPKFPFLLILPLIAIIILTFHSRFRRFLLHVPPQWLIYLQTFRVTVEIFLWWLFLDEAIPIQMTFEGRNFDILAGLTAPVFGWLCYGRGRNRRVLAASWNLLGLGLLLNIVITAVLSLPTPLRIFMNEPSSIVVTTFPFIFLPAALVPFAYSLHFFSLRKIWLENKAEAIPE